MFTFRIFLITLLIVTLFSSFHPAQFNTEKLDSICEKGIFLENRGIIIPWGANFNEVIKIGDPGIICVSRSLTKVTWDSSKIFDSIPVDLYAFFNGCFQKKSPKRSLFDMYGSIDSNSIERIKEYLDKNIGAGDFLKDTEDIIIIGQALSVYSK